MRLEALSVSNFGPFRDYRIEFPHDDRVCLLLTGRNNEGKSNLIFALQLLRAGTHVLDKARQRISVGDKIYYRLLQHDVGDFRVGRLVHNYSDSIATVRATFSGGSEVTVYLDPLEDLVYADATGRLARDASSLFGFIPPLGRLAETEERLSPIHVRNSIDSTLAPRHFRNHLDQILTPEDLRLVQQIIRESWVGVELLHTEYEVDTNRLLCFYREGAYDREVSWAGQGLQVWFQIVAHMVRLRNTAILVLDEPEINLHPEKQNELIRLLREYHSGSVIVATHSVELMNNVGVSHIVHIQKRHPAPTIKSTNDRAQLEVIRSRIGSNFNLVASQFEAVDTVVFTEDQSDFAVVRGLMSEAGDASRIFNIPLHGFSEYPKAKHYRDAYDLLLGKTNTRFSILLDRDYYPESYLAQVQADLQKAEIKTTFTPGKEIENLFLDPSLLRSLVSQSERAEWEKFWDSLFEEFYLDAFGSWVQLHEDFAGLGRGKKVLVAVTPDFDKRWKEASSRHLMLPGKQALRRIRDYHRNKGRGNLSQPTLINGLMKVSSGTVRSWLREITQKEGTKRVRK